MKITIPDSLRALRSRNYRLFFMAQAISLTGLWMHRVAMGWLVFRLTGLNSNLGIVDFTSSISVFLLAPFAGAMIERWDLRKTLFWCQTGCMIIAFVLAFLTLARTVTFRIVVFMSLMLGLLDAFELPCRYSLVSYMVDRREDISNGVALNSVNFNVARMIGPTIAGFVIHAIGEGVCFLVNGFAYSSTLLAIKKMKMEHPPIGKNDGGKLQPFKDTAEGIRMARKFAPSRYLLVMMACTGFFCFPAIVLMPAMAKSVLGGTSRTLGFLLMGIAIGALLGSFTMASLKSSDKLSWWCTRACLSFGISVSLFSLSNNIYAGIVLAIPVGFCMVTSTISCNTLLQSMAPASNRSRIMALYTMAILGIPPFGSLLSGKLGDSLGTNWALFICGMMSSVIAYYFLRKVDGIKDIILTALRNPEAVKWEA